MKSLFQHTKVGTYSKREEEEIKYNKWQKTIEFVSNCYIKESD